MGKRSIQVVANLDAVAALAAERIADAASASKDKFSIALGGGEISILVYEQLTSDEFSRRIDWKNWHIYFTDERCVAPSRVESNFRIVSETLLDQSTIAPEHLHRIKGEIVPPQAAEEYGRMLKQNFGDAGPDLVLLEMGGEGQIAGLVPHSPALEESHHRCVENYYDILKEWRITMTAPFINRAALVIVMASGADKSDLVAEALEGERDPALSPAQLIEPGEGEVLWLMDAEAAGMNDEE